VDAANRQAGAVSGLGPSAHCRLSGKRGRGRLCGPIKLPFLALYKELVETNTTLSTGSCTLGAGRLAAHLKAAGFPDADITLFSTLEHAKESASVSAAEVRDLFRAQE